MFVFPFFCRTSPRLGFLDVLGSSDAVLTFNPADTICCRKLAERQSSLLEFWPPRRSLELRGTTELGSSFLLSQVNLSKVILLFLKNSKETTQQAPSADVTHAAAFLLHLIDSACQSKCSLGLSLWNLIGLCICARRTGTIMWRNPTKTGFVTSALLAFGAR